MPKRIRPIWGDEKPAKTLGSPAASAETDSESGNEGAGRDKDLYALEVMRDRGLISEETYERRKAALLERGPDSLGRK